ncbi:MAG: metalloregulator ArsR/SmtB family transcription factor [candidate division WOR-3 bacterium]|nr:metalloregulator ArsR/SmtB family transcription factor [candidate division WOR-3 bacterium]
MKRRDVGAAVCNCNVIHKAAVRKVRSVMPPSERRFELADFFRVFGDSTRIGILLALGRAELCVCDIGALLGMSQSAVSHQLKVLRQTRLVRYRREGKIAYYSLNDEHVRAILSLGIQHAEE